MPKVAFLFKRGRRERLASVEKSPSEFFYGFVQLAENGAPVVILDEDDLNIAGPISLPWRLASALSHKLIGVHLWAVWRLARRDQRARLNEFEVLVATTNAFGLSLAVLKRLGMLHSQVVFLAMGLTREKPHQLVRMVYARIFRHIKLAVISRQEQQHLAAMFPDITLHYVPFGVDHRFWTSGQPSDIGDYVLSVGNDPHRDYDALINAWLPEFPELRIVTKLSIPKHSCANVKIIAGDWRTQRLSDAALREMVQCSRLVVVPVRDTLQPSGQSACLQAMACGKAVILSDIAGLWDRELMRNGENCVLVSPGDAKAISRSVQWLLENPDRAEAIGRAARETVEKHFNMDVMTQAMQELCAKSPAAAAVL